MKKCFKCGMDKELKEFYKHKAMKDGHLNKCIECAKKDVALHRQLNLESVRAYDRRRGSTKHRKSLNVKITRERRKKFPWKRIAYEQVRRAIQQGLIVKSPCVICGSKKSEAHHEDYLKPLDVMWLCKKHHEERHRVIGDFSVKSKVLI